MFDANTGRLTNTQAGSSNTVQNAAYGYDTVGNLTQRTDLTQALVEGFTHDPLNRRTSSQIVDGPPAKTVTYNAIGNITSKSDVGTYAYPATGSARPPRSPAIMEPKL